MLHWLVDNVLWFYILFGLVAAALLYLWWINRRRALLFALCAVAGLLVLLFLLSWFVVTPRQQITNALYEMAEGVSANKPDQVLKHLAKDFRFKTLTRADVAAAINRGVTLHGIQDVFVWNFQFDELAPAEKKAKVSFHFRVTGVREEIGFALCRSEFVEEEGKWRMKSINFFKPVAGSDQELPIPVP